MNHFRGFSHVSTCCLCLKAAPFIQPETNGVGVNHRLLICSVYVSPPGDSTDTSMFQIRLILVNVYKNDNNVGRTFLKKETFLCSFFQISQGNVAEVSVFTERSRRSKVKYMNMKQDGATACRKCKAAEFSTD